MAVPGKGYRHMQPHHSPPPEIPPPSYNDQRWHAFVIVEFVLVFVFVGLFCAGNPSTSAPWVGWVIGGLGAWLGFTLPIAFLYLIGKPPIMSLSPLIESAEARAYRRELKTRPEIDENLFFERYYSHTDVPRGIPIRLRRMCMDHLDPLFRKVAPDDRPWLLVEDLDIAPLIKDIEREWDITMSAQQCAAIDTFDSLVRFIKEASPPYRSR